MQYDVTASIVLYRNDASVKNAITSFLSTKKKIKLYLIDNSPTDNLKYLAAQDNRIEYCFNNANVGFGAGHNIALKNALELSKYHLVLNPDICFKDNTIEKLYDFMETDLEVGHVMPKIYYPNEETQYVCKLIPTPFDLIFKRFLPGSFVKKRTDKFQLKFTGYNNQMDVPYLSGCFMFLRTSALKEIGLFDEQFFMYPEDIDLTRRMHMKFRTVFYPLVSVIHKHEAGSYKNFRLLYIHIANMIKYFNKWGWFFDQERETINDKILTQFKQE